MGQTAVSAKRHLLLDPSLCFPRPLGALSGPDRLRPRHHRLRIRGQRRGVRRPPWRDATGRHDADAGGLPQLSPRLRHAQKVRD